MTNYYQPERLAAAEAKLETALNAEQEALAATRAGDEHKAALGKRQAEKLLDQVGALKAEAVAPPVGGVEPMLTREEKVAVGTVVTLRYDDGAVKRYVVGKPGTTRPVPEVCGIDHLVGIDSPIGIAIRGAVRGEERSFFAGRLRRTVLVEGIEPADVVA